ADAGGAVKAIEQGIQKGEIERAAYDIAGQIDSGERVVVGLNKYQLAEEERYEPLRLDPSIGKNQAARLAELRERRDQQALD
ncbi:methylmalonyl-CoA mutase family protein, partial [Acinetobacter baumannii]|uniref:methylmalonyl-CoA mutase family protein n=1 Tax=Acinetobacter baumannii TaxID=470 RepID=UPI002091217C